MLSDSSLWKRIQIPLPIGATTAADWRLQSDDLLPVESCKRQWSHWSFIYFWISESFNITTFSIAAGMIAIGLTWYQSLLAVILGYSISAIFLVLNAIPGAKHHIIFAAYARSSFGPVGALWIVFNRAAMAVVWYSVTSWIGGECVYLLLVAIFPSFAKLPNGIISSGTNTAHFLSFFLFSLFSLVAIWFPLHQIRHLFTIKAVVAPLAGMALFAWSVSRAGGIGPIIQQPATAKFGWNFLIAISSCIGNMVTLIVNSTDFASRANKQSAVVLPQLLTIPLIYAVTSLVGIFIASSSSLIFGSFIWNPLDLLQAFLDEEGAGAGTRAAVAFIMIGFIIAQLGTNIAANSISAGCDLTALLPRYISIRRGSYIAAAVGFGMCPWNLLKDSNAFTSYLSAYSVFLSSVVGVMLSNYYIVSKRRLSVDALYTLEKDGRYTYWHGINFRAYGAYIAGILINFPGFLGVFGVTVPLAATRIYELSFFTGFLVSSIVYILLNKLFPVALPSEEECSIVTVGTLDWVAKRSEQSGEEGDYYDQKEMEKKDDDVFTSVKEIEEE